MNLRNRIMVWLLQWTPEQWNVIRWMTILWLSLFLAMLAREQQIIHKQAHKIQSLQKGYQR